MVRSTGTAMSEGLLSSTTRGVTLTSARICALMSCCQAARPLPLGFDAKNNSTAQVVLASSLTKPPLLLAPNVSDCVEVLLQPRFSAEEDAFVSGTASSKHMTKDFTTLVPSTMVIKRLLQFGMDWMSPRFAL